MSVLLPSSFYFSGAIGRSVLKRVKNAPLTGYSVFERCWLRGVAFYASFVVPVSVILVLNVVAFVLVLRMHPTLVEDIVAYAHDVPPRTQQASFEAPRDVYVRPMPSDAVPVRRWGAPEAVGADTQNGANAVARELRTLSPGG